MSRRTNRQSTPRLGARVDDRVEPVARGVRDRDEDDVWLAGAASSALELVQAADAPGRRATRRRRSARVVVDEADDALARRLAQLAHEAPPGPAGADDQRRGARCGREASAVPPMTIRSANRDAGDRDGAEERVDDEERAREVAERVS